MLDDVAGEVAKNQRRGCSRLTGFEAPDPVYCVQQGYAVLQADVRGMHKSEGKAGVIFSGYNGYERDGLAKGWLRASHRELDPTRSTPLRPWHSHTRIQKLRSGDIVPLEIEIWPSATLFEGGSTLQLTIQGHDAARYPGFGHRKLVNRGLHTIFTGGRYDSCLVVPLNNRRSE